MCHLTTGFQKKGFGAFVVLSPGFKPSNKLQVDKEVTSATFLGVTINSL